MHSIFPLHLGECLTKSSNHLSKTALNTSGDHLKALRPVSEAKKINGFAMGYVPTLTV